MIENADRLIALADSMEPKLRRTLLRLIGDLQNNASVGQIEAALRRRSLLDLLKALKVAAAIEDFKPSLLAVIRDLVEEAASIAPLPAGIEYRFDIINAESVNYLKTATLNTSLQIKQETEHAIREAMMRGFTEGMAPRELASEIRARVGLTDFQWRTVENFERYITNLSDRFETTDDLSQTALNRLRRAGLRNGGSLNRQGLTNDRIDTLVSNYTKKLIGERATTIARTLVIDASNEGQNMLWRQASEKGLLDSRSWLVKWIITKDIVYPKNWTGD